ncbi:MAG: hypothetical protein EBV81_05560 [Proteobacteria bacterium]|nr:hypothetical protein [Candidatus Fonsibacter sp. PEL5]
MSYQTLIETFYLIFKPLKPMGIDAKSFAVRLYLTMEYVKSFQSKRRLNFNFNDLSSLLLNSNNKAHKKHTYIEIKEESIIVSDFFNGIRHFSFYFLPISLYENCFMY